MQEDAPAVWRGPMVMSALDSFMTKVSWAPLDVLVIDMPPGTGQSSAYDMDVCIACSMFTHLHATEGPVRSRVFPIDNSSS